VNIEISAMYLFFERLIIFVYSFILQYVSCDSMILRLYFIVTAADHDIAKLLVIHV